MQFMCNVMECAILYINLSVCHTKSKCFFAENVRAVPKGLIEIPNSCQALVHYRYALSTFFVCLIGQFHVQYTYLYLSFSDKVWAVCLSTLLWYGLACPVRMLADVSR